MDTMGTLSSVGSGSGSGGTGTTGAGLGMLGSGISAGAKIGSGIASERAANYEAALYRQKAARDLAAGQRAGFEQSEQTNRVLGTAQARGAASGVSMGGSPTISAIMGDIAQRGSYLARSQLYKGQVEQGQDLAEAAAAKMRGRNALTGSILEGVGTLGSGVAKYGPKMGTGSLLSDPSYG